LISFVSPLTLHSFFDLYAQLTIRYEKGRAVFDFLFGVKFHKTFPRMIRDASTSCGTGIYPSTDHRGAIGAAEQQAWGSGVDILVMVAEQCDLACQNNPQKEYKKDSYAKKAEATSNGKKVSSSSGSGKSGNYITAPLKGSLQYARF
jgi:hypothetical protein